MLDVYHDITLIFFEHILLKASHQECLLICILTFISMINTTSERLKQETSLFGGILVFMSS